MSGFIYISDKQTAGIGETEFKYTAKRRIKLKEISILVSTNIVNDGKIKITLAGRTITDGYVSLVEGSSGLEMKFQNEDNIYLRQGEDLTISIQMATTTGAFQVMLIGVEE